MAVTKAERLIDIKAILTSEEPPYGSTVTEAVELLDKMVEQLNRPRVKSDKPTAKQIENEGYSVDILDYLRTNPEGATCTDIIKNVESVSDFQNQKIASLLRKMIEKGAVRKEKVKNRMVFYAA